MYRRRKGRDLWGTSQDIRSHHGEREQTLHLLEELMIWGKVLQSLSGQEVAKRQRTQDKDVLDPQSIGAAGYKSRTSLVLR